MPYTPNFSPGDVLTAANMNSIGEAWTTFTPTWTSTGTAPAIGNGTVKATYCRINKVVHARISILFGSTTTFGTGDWRFALPVTANSDYSAGSVYGYARMVDTSGPGVYAGWSCNALTNDYTKFYIEASFTGAGASSTVPFTWANTDFISILLTYEAA